MHFTKCWIPSAFKQLKWHWRNGGFWGFKTEPYCPNLEALILHCKV